MNSKTPYESPRQRVWNSIRKNREKFTIAQVAEDGNTVYESARGFVSQLAKAGIVKILDEKPIHHENCLVKQRTYQLIKDIGYTYPTMTKSGELIIGVSGNKAMWNTLRITKQPINADELAAISSNDTLTIEVTTANNYLMLLHKAGYLKRTKEPNRNIGGKAKYLLLPDMNTGPKPPQVQRVKHVFDPNINQVMFAERPELEEELKHGTILGEFNA
ncbi:hypothetical protein [Acinetobacter sp. ANC 5502]